MSEASEETLLEQLLERALDLQEQGVEVDVTALCVAHPHLATAVAAALARVPELARLHVERAEADAFVGRLLARRYRLEERVGSGAMGVVYRGFDLALDREVAVKVLRPELLVGERMDVRLAREGQVLAGIRHQNVVTVFDRGQAEDGRSFLVMELLRGHNAARLLRGIAEAHGGPVSGSARAAAFRDVLGVDVAVGEGDVRQVVRWVVAAADGLQAAHDSGVVHRDVKPSNLFLERGGRVVLLDFGIVSSGGQGTLGSDGSPFGTPAYMAPEQLAADAEPDVRSDVYSLTATLYHLLTGRAPFDGTVPQVLAAIPSVEPEAVERVRPGLPNDLAAIVEKGMSKDPARRYQSARELRDDLQAWLEFRPVMARRASRWTSAWRRARRSPRVRTAFGVLLSVGLVLGGWQWSVVRAEARDDREVELWSQVPPSLVNDPPEYREGSALRRSARVVGLLDELVELDRGACVAHALRAMHRADCGDFAGAAADLEVIATRSVGPFARLAAEHYRRGERPDALALGQQAPEVGGVGDRFAVALHALRSHSARPGWVAELLERDGALDRYPGCAELHLVLRFRQAYEREDAQEVRLIARDARRTEALRGRDSAILHFLLMNEAMIGRDAVEGLRLAEQAQQLAPDGFALRIMGGRFALQAFDWERAEQMFRSASELQPGSADALVGIGRAMIGAGRYDGLPAILEREPLNVSAEARGKRDLLQAAMLYRKAWHSALTEQLGGESEATSAAASWATDAERALELFAAARAALQDERGTSIEELLCRRLLGAEVSFVEAFDLLAATPLDADLLEQIARMLPEALSAAEVSALTRLLLRQTEALGLIRR